MGINRLIQAEVLGSDWSKYTPCIGHITGVSVAQSATVSALKITGKGYMSLILADIGSSSSYNPDIQILVDDEPIARSYTGANAGGMDTPGGIVTMDLINLFKYVYNTTSLNYGLEIGGDAINDFSLTNTIQSKRLEKYPANQVSNYGFIPLVKPLFFEKSLEVRFIAYSGATGSVTAGFKYRGGVI